MVDTSEVFGLLIKTKLPEITTALETPKIDTHFQNSKKLGSSILSESNAIFAKLFEEDPSVNKSNLSSSVLVRED